MSLGLGFYVQGFGAIVRGLELRVWVWVLAFVGL